MPIDPEASRRRDEIVALLADPEADALSLSRAALLMSCEEYGFLEIEPYLGTLDGWGEAVRGRVAGLGTADAVEVLNDFLFDEQRLRGNVEEYYDARNSFLSDVLDRRQGIPITLSLVYMHVATRAGLPVRGVGLPGHFVVRVGELLVDPFNRGRVLTRDDCRALVRTRGGRAVWREELAAPWEPRLIMVRVLNNLKGIYLRGTDFDRALWVQDLLVRLAPEDARELRDRGLVHAQLANYGAARYDLMAYLKSSPAPPEDAEAIEKDLEKLRRLHLMSN